MTHGGLASSEQSSDSQEVVTAEVVQPRPVGLGMFVLVVLIVDLGLRAYGLLVLPFTLVQYAALPEGHWMRATPLPIVLLGAGLAVLGIIADVLILKKRRAGVILGWIVLALNLALYVVNLPLRFRVASSALSRGFSFLPQQVRPHSQAVGLVTLLALLLGIAINAGWLLLYGAALVVARRRLAELEQATRPRRVES